MRKKLSLVLSVVIASAVLGLGPARSDPLPIRLADLESVVQGEPDEVSPVGGSVYYTVAFRNNGPLPVLADLTDTTTGGGTYLALQSDVADCAAPASGTPDPVITCDRVLAPGEELVIEVAIGTSSATTFIKNTATASVHPVLDPIVDDQPGNNSDEVETPVFNNPNGSSASVAEGDSLSFSNAHVDSKVTVTDASDKPITIYLEGADPKGDRCGTSPCGPGLHLGFGTEADRQGMLRVDVTFRSEPCFGVGADKCKQVYERKNSGGTNETINLVPECSTLSFEDTKTTCRLDGKPSKDGRFIRHSFRMASEDPDLMPVGSLEL